MKATANNANSITTAQTLAGITQQISDNNKDLPVAAAAIVKAGTPEALSQVAAANCESPSYPPIRKPANNQTAVAGLKITSKAAAVQTVSVDNVGVNKDAAATGVAAAVTTSATKSSKNKATATAAAAAATTTAATKGNKNKNNKRNLRMARWFGEESA